ncbi:MAG: HlyD family efflux transporter periplasmic adaptor subunit [Bryobacterales bacterium]|nr:HlyD family efflux transporter periplasmic adaptor subunit [Bryobacterales bacterium]
MQPYSTPAPTTPAPPDRKLTPVAPVERPKRGFPWGWVLLLAVIAAGAFLWQRKAADQAAGPKTAAASVRSSKVGGGKVSHTIRLTGTTGPEKFSTILGPQLRGSRSVMGGGGPVMGRGSSGRGGGSGGPTVSSNSGGGSSGGSGGSSSGGSSAGAGLSSAMSAGGGGGGLAGGASGASMGGGAGVRSASSALRSSTSRERTSSRSSSSGAGRSTASAAASTLGSEGLGSTSSSLYGGGGSSGGGGGGSSMGDFGAILQDLIKPGSSVNKGTQVAEFDRQYMLQRLDDYKAGVVQQELNMKRLESDLDVSRKSHEQSILIAKADVEKAKLDLRTVPVRSAIDTERFKLALEEAEARYKQLLQEVPYVRAGEAAQVKLSEMDLQQSKIELRRAEANADRMVVKAPIDGMVVMLQMFRGSEFGQVQAGDPIPPGMPYLQIVDPSSMIVNATVNQVDVEKIRVGAKARIRFDAFPDLELPGRVYSLAAMPRSGMSARASYLKEIPVRVRLDRMDPRVIPDLSVSVDVVIEEEEAAAIVPLGSVFRDGDAGTPYVFVRAGDRWERRGVELGLASSTMVAVRTGVKAGETIADQRPPTPAPEQSS